MRAAVSESENRGAERKECKRTIFHNGDCDVHIEKLARCAASVFFGLSDVDKGIFD